jgi:hypothetical protein
MSEKLFRSWKIYTGALPANDSAAATACVRRGEWLSHGSGSLPSCTSAAFLPQPTPWGTSCNWDNKDLNVMGLVLETWSSYTWFVCSVMVFRIVQTWVHEIAHPIIGFRNSPEETSERVNMFLVCATSSFHFRLRCLGSHSHRKSNFRRRCGFARRRPAAATPRPETPATAPTAKAMCPQRGGWGVENPFASCLNLVPQKTQRSFSPYLGKGITLSTIQNTTASPPSPRRSPPPPRPPARSS